MSLARGIRAVKPPGHGIGLGLSDLLRVAAKGLRRLQFARCITQHRTFKIQGAVHHGPSTYAEGSPAVMSLAVVRSIAGCEYSHVPYPHTLKDIFQKGN